MNDSIPSHTDNDVESVVGNVTCPEPLCIAGTDSSVLERAIGMVESAKFGSNCVEERSDLGVVDLVSLLLSSEGIDNDAESSSF
jgi:hypothetical protein